MRILLISQYHFPVINPRAIRWQAMLEVWQEQGHEVTLVTTRRQAQPRKEMLGHVRVYRDGYATLLDLAYALYRPARRRGEAGGRPGKSTGLLARALQRFIDLTWRALYWPDGAMLWLLPAWLRLRALRHQFQPDLVISTGIPFSAHLIGYMAKRQWPAARWHLEVADPFALARDMPSNNFALWGWLNRPAERHLLRRADRVSFTHRLSLEAHLRFHPSLASMLEKKSEVIPPLRSCRPATELTLPLPQEALHIGYFGSFYRGVREPSVFLPFLRLLGESGLPLHFHYAGEAPSGLAAQVQELLEVFPIHEDHGLLTPEAVCALMQRMDVLLHFGNTTPYHLPSKSVDCLGSGLPVLHLSQSDPDSFLEFAGDRPMVHTVRLDNLDVDEAVTDTAEFLRANRRRRLPLEAMRGWLKPCTAEVIAGRYLDGW